jgi:tetraacyldisaccharide 4'-kinase
VLAVRRRIASALERGALSGAWSSALAGAYAPFATRALARPLVVPRGIATVTVGGTTLGGSGKTRLALAIARELAARGASVVLVGHAYRARPSVARFVSAEDALERVGDEALMCARALAASGRVVVASRRQAAVDLAVRGSAPDVLVLDGPLQLSPVRASLALLAVDACAPWGAGALPPAGDLRAPRAALLAAADLVVPVDATPRAVVVDGVRLALGSLADRAARGCRLGLFTAIARPDRLERALEGAGIPLACVVRAPDHGPVDASLARRLAAAEVDLWIATEKCSLHLERASARAIAVLDGGVELPRALLDALDALDLRCGAAARAPRRAEI